MKRLVMVCLVMLMSVASVGCATNQQTYQKSPLTPGMAKKYIVPGKTHQAEVLSIFGPPDIVTRRWGKEVWTYDKISHDVSSSSGFLTILLAGYGSERRRSANRSMMLIIYFTKDDTVRDYDLHATKF
jgi:outer membrane protein assembly factor BamE (lipoprotein component of BamABCDE complex)